MSLQIEDLMPLSKFVVLVVAMSMLFSCKVNRDHITRYYDVEAFQEQEMILLLARDSSFFTLEDRLGCNRFKFTGKYKQYGTYPAGYLVFNHVQSHKVMVVPDTKGFSRFTMETPHGLLIVKESLYIKRPLR